MIQLKRFLKRNKVTILATVAWSTLLAISLIGYSGSIQREILDDAHTDARAILDKDSAFRRWSTRHGGVYVPITDIQKPVPWMSHVPRRDITTIDGQDLTLLNPASMFRQMMENYAEEYGVRGRITGLKYLNPSNKPDAWEKEQLERFTREEVTEVETIAQLSGQPHIRYLRALYMAPGCEKCHAVLGYKVGDMRGATGLNLPLTPYFKDIEQAQQTVLISHSLIWVLGLAAIVLAQQRRNERKRREQEQIKAAKNIQIYASAFEGSGDAILISDHENRIIDVNPAFIRQTGYSLDEVQGKNPRMLGSGETPREIYQQMWATLSEKGFWQGELLDRAKNGRIYPKWTSISAIRNQEQNTTFYVASFSDITARKAAEERISQLAHNDILTGLCNRFSFESRLEQAVFTARREQRELAILFINMDRFKNINDSLGHHTGDKILKEVASRLMNCARESDIIARFGGDEFVVVLTAVEDSNRVAHITENILELLSKPYVVNDRDLDTSPSIGITVFPGDGDAPGALLHNADTAMCHAKTQGRKNYQFYSKSMSAAIQERLRIESDLRTALEENQFELYYQPQIRTDNNTVCVVEALIRWHHPQHGMVGPHKFIPIAEETWYIHDIGCWVLDEACRQLAAWKETLSSPIGMAVNLSTKQLQSEDLIEFVQATMQKHAIEPEELELEITETSAMDNPDLAVQQLNALSQIGVKLSIDDFGTGYSSLAYLKRLPIQAIKLDREFVSNLEHDEDDAKISIATLSLAHNLGLKVVAEGVETEAQRDFLISYGCDYLQGFLFSKPLPAAEVEQLIKSTNK